MIEEPSYDSHGALRIARHDYTAIIDRIHQTDTLEVLGTNGGEYPVIMVSDIKDRTFRIEWASSSKQWTITRTDIKYVNGQTYHQEYNYTSHLLKAIPDLIHAP